MSIATRQPFKMGKRQVEKDRAADRRVEVQFAAEKGAAEFGERFLDFLHHDGESLYMVIAGERHTRQRLTLAEFAKSIYGAGVLRKVGPGRFAVLKAPQGQPQAIRVMPAPGRAASWSTYDDGGPGLDTSMGGFGHGV